MRKTIWLALIAAIGCTPASRDASDTPPVNASDIVGWTATAGSPRPGMHESRVVDIDLTVKVSDGWHVYSLTQLTGGPTPMSVTVLPPYQMTGEVTGPQPVKANDNNFGIVTETYSGAQTFRFAVEIPNKVAELPPIEFKVKSQACSDKLCLPAKTQTITVTPGNSTT